MSFGQHAVVVEPSRFLGQPTELAERLAPVLRVPVDQVVSMLDRGAVTVDADLDVGAAQRLLKRLDALGVPAELRDGNGTTISATTARESKPPNDDSNDSDAWGAVLPDRPSSSAATRGQTHEPDEVDDRSASLIAQFEATARQTDEHDRNSPPRKAQPQAQRTEPSTQQGGAPPRPASPPPPQPASPGPRTSSPPPASPDPPTKKPVERREPSAPALPDRTFDASLITAALTNDADKPPYAPTGFDAAPPHLPGLASALSVFAPGAGQIYNGDDDEALGFGLKFFLVVPWIESVRDANRRGHKIATYWLPRPEEGALFRAVKYALLWWVCVAAIGTILALVGSAVFDQLTREPVVEITEAEISMAMEDAQTEVRLGRIAAMQALSEAQLNVPSKRFTMSDKERAQRLFIIGYKHCESQNYGGCEALMKRVASLKQKNAAQAFRLQAWASAARSGNVGKFPEVTGVRSLSEFEAAAMSQELGVPAPPPRPTRTSTPDAGAPGESSPADDTLNVQGDVP